MWYSDSNTNSGVTKARRNSNKSRSARRRFAPASSAGVLALDFLQQRERGRVKCVSDDWAVLVIDEETKHAT